MGSRRRSSSCEPVLIAVEMSGEPSPLHSLEVKSQDVLCKQRRHANSTYNLESEIMLAADLTKYGNPIDALTSSLTFRRNRSEEIVRHSFCSSPNDLTPSLKPSSSQPLQQLFERGLGMNSLSNQSLSGTKSLASKMHTKVDLSNVGGKA